MIAKFLGLNVDPMRKRERLELKLIDQKQNKAWLEAHVKELNSLEKKFESLQTEKRSFAYEKAKAAYEAVAHTTLPAGKSYWLTSVTEVERQIAATERRIKSLQ